MWQQSTTATNAGSFVRAVWCASFITALATCALARPAVQEAGRSRAPGGVVTGRVTVGGNPAPGVRVLPVPAAPADGDSQHALKAMSVTDAEGKYRLTGVPAGTYTLAVAGGYVIQDAGRPKAVVIKEGEEANVDLTLVRGGVITGRVSDADGQPLIGARVSTHASVEGGPRRKIVTTYNSAETDDRGVYRLYGLPAGRYTLSLTPWRSPGAARGAGANPAVTYYPGVTDESQAAAVEVKVGDEIENVDIKLGRADAAFNVTGRVVNEETGGPVPNTACDYAEVTSRQPSAPSGCVTDANGEFRIEKVRPGRYVMFTVADPASDLYGEPTPFDVTGDDVRGVEVKVRRGATITGTAVVEGNDPTGRSRLPEVSVVATHPGKFISRGSATAKVAADGSFLLRGVGPGKVTLIILSPPRQDFSLLRVEQNGAEQARGIDVAAGEPVAAVRLVLAYGKGSIHGRIRAQGGALPPGSSVSISIAPAGSPARPIRFARAEGGEFLSTDVPAGEYELTARVILPAVAGARSPRVPPSRQNVSVKNGANTEVTVVLDLSQLK